MHGPGNTLEGGTGFFALCGEGNLPHTVVFGGSSALDISPVLQLVGQNGQCAFPSADQTGDAVHGEVILAVQTAENQPVRRHHAGKSRAVQFLLQKSVQSVPDAGNKIGSEGRVFRITLEHMLSRKCGWIRVNAGAYGRMHFIRCRTLFFAKNVSHGKYYFVRSVCRVSIIDSTPVE